MVNQLIVDILVKRIEEGWINSKTRLPLILADILREDYREAVKIHLNKQ
jgi:isopentenyl diphosphate isomerase/L-lactate dehydrogenase-like FMN-dependent dehydrogenase